MPENMPEGMPKDLPEDMPEVESLFNLFLFPLPIAHCQLLHPHLHPRYPLRLGLLFLLQRCHFLFQLFIDVFTIKNLTRDSSAFKLWHCKTMRLDKSWNWSHLLRSSTIVRSVWDKTITTLPAVTTSKILQRQYSWERDTYIVTSKVDEGYWLSNWQNIKCSFCLFHKWDMQTMT